MDKTRSRIWRPGSLISSPGSPKIFLEKQNSAEFSLEMSLIILHQNSTFKIGISVYKFVFRIAQFHLVSSSEESPLANGNKQTSPEKRKPPNVA